MNAVDVCIASGLHEAAKVSVGAFIDSTERLPHRQSEEAVQDGLLYRNCLRCSSTLAIELDPAEAQAAA